MTQPFHDVPVDIAWNHDFGTATTSPTLEVSGCENEGAQKRNACDARFEVDKPASPKLSVSVPQSFSFMPCGPVWIDKA